MSKRIVITGAAGQDGLILGLKLVQRGHEVFGLVRNDVQRKLVQKYNPLVNVSIVEFSNLEAVKNFCLDIQPEQIFHLSAKSSVANSWKDSEETLQTNIFHTLNWLNALNDLGMHNTRFFHASSSEMFGLPNISPQSEETFLHPRSPYGVSKVASHHLVINYRESYGQFGSTGILFNHESPLRKPYFVTRKISQGVAKIAKGAADNISLGNIDISRDWGWAPDFVEGMISIINHESPDDFVLATGTSNSLKKFIELAFTYIGIEDWEKYISFDESLSRPAEVVSVLGDFSKANNALNWKPKFNLDQIVHEMIKFDLHILETGLVDLLWREK